MTKCETFLNYFDTLLEQAGIKFDDVPKPVQDFYDVLKASKNDDSSKPTFTAIGLQVLEFMQQSTLKSLKAKDIAEGLQLPSRKASGAMRKLVNDGYVEKYGETPVNYMLTDSGREIDVTQFKQEINDN